MPSKLCATLFAFSFFVYLSTRAHAIDLYALGSYWEVEDAEGSWGAGLGASIPIFTDHVRIDARAYAFENSDFDGDDELELIPLDLGLQIHLRPDQDLDPYILGGVSWVYADTARLEVDSEFGAYIGAGADFQFTSRLRPFGEIVYRIAELEPEAVSRDDIEISGVTVNFGLKLHL